MATTDFYAAAGVLVAVLGGAGVIALAVVLLRHTLTTHRYRRRRREAIKVLQARGMWPFDNETTKAYIRERIP